MEALPLVQSTTASGTVHDEQPPARPRQLLRPRERERRNAIDWILPYGSDSLEPPSTASSSRPSPRPAQQAPPPPQRAPSRRPACAAPRSRRAGSPARGTTRKSAGDEAARARLMHSLRVEPRQGRVRRTWRMTMPTRSTMAIVLAAHMTWTCSTRARHSIGGSAASALAFSRARSPRTPVLRSASHDCMRVKKSSPGRMRAALLNGALRERERSATAHR